MARESLSNLQLDIWDTQTCIARADALAACLAVMIPDDWSDFAAKLGGRRRLMAVVATDSAGALAGFKIGYELRRDILNSWLGGVMPDFRGQGLAQKLMAVQHDWATKAGFQGIETATRQANRIMGIVNLRGGFVVAGLDVRPDEPTKVIYFKALRSHEGHGS